MTPRCQCYGYCGFATGKPRACAEPDLTGRCRAEQGVAHPRGYQLAEITKFRIGPEEWVWVCRDCLDLYESGAAPQKSTTTDDPLLFVEGEK